MRLVVLLDLEDHLDLQERREDLVDLVPMDIPEILDDHRRSHANRRFHHVIVRTIRDQLDNPDNLVNQEIEDLLEIQDQRDQTVSLQKVDDL